MTKLVDDDIARETVAARTGAIEVINASTTVFLRIDEDIDLIVRHLSRQIANVAVISAHAVALRIKGPEAEPHDGVFVDVVTRHGATALSRRSHHATDVEALAIAIVWRVVEHALHEEVAILDKLAHLNLGVAFGKNHNINGFGHILVANPSLVDGKIELVIVADEIIIGTHGEPQPFFELSFPSLMTQNDVNLHFGERHDDRLVEGLGDQFRLVCGLPLAVKVLVAFRKQQMVRTRLINLDNVAAKLQVVDKVGFGTTPIGLVDEFLERECSFLAIARQAIVHTERRLRKKGIKLGPCHYRQQGKQG